MRGELTKTILEAVSETAIHLTDLMAVLTNAPYGSSYTSLQYHLNKREQTRSQRKSLRDVRQRYYNLIYKLKRDHLIQDNGKGLLKTIQKGKNWIRHFGEVMPSKHHITFKTDRFIIVAFDIKETERQKRDWLRACLKNIGLQMIQKSVWLGKIKLPQEFIDDLKKLNLLESVEIFEITKTGTLKHVI